VSQDQARISLTLVLTAVLLNRGHHEITNATDGRFNQIQTALWARPEIRRQLAGRLPADLAEFLDDVCFSPLSIAPEVRDLVSSLLEEA
jgi:hypothetical protein